MTDIQGGGRDREGEGEERWNTTRWRYWSTEIWCHMVRPGITVLGDASPHTASTERLIRREQSVIF